jgi:CrcB protein
VNWLMVGVGGAIGSIARYGVSLGAARVFGSPLPYATAIVNIIGCGAAGALAGALLASPVRPETRAFVFVGVLGGFTTFSAFGLDTVTLVSEGRAGAALLNVALQLTLGLGAAFLGYTLAK